MIYDKYRFIESTRMWIAPWRWATISSTAAMLELVMANKTDRPAILL